MSPYIELAVMQHHSSLARFETDLRELLLPQPPSRPFLSEGSPLDCEVVLVGINPATVTPFWPFWSTAAGFNKVAWLESYYADPKNTKNQTRPRIELLRHELSPYKCLELNIYPYSSPSEPELPAHLRDTRVFDFMLRAVRPKLLFVFGNTPIKELERLLGVSSLEKKTFNRCTYNGSSFAVVADSHLSRGWSKQRVGELAKTMKAYLATNAD